MFSCKFNTYFQNTFKNIYGGLLLHNPRAPYVLAYYWVDFGKINVRTESIRIAKVIEIINLSENKMSIEEVQLLRASREVQVDLLDGHITSQRSNLLGAKKMKKNVLEWEALFKSVYEIRKTLKRLLVDENQLQQQLSESFMKTLKTKLKLRKIMEEKYEQNTANIDVINAGKHKSRS